MPSPAGRPAQPRSKAARRRSEAAQSPRLPPRRRRPVLAVGVADQLIAVGVADQLSSSAFRRAGLTVGVEDQLSPSVTATSSSRSASPTSSHRRHRRAALTVGVADQLVTIGIADQLVAVGTFHPFLRPRWEPGIGLPGGPQVNVDTLCLSFLGEPIAPPFPTHFRPMPQPQTSMRPTFVFPEGRQCCHSRPRRPLRRSLRSTHPATLIGTTPRVVRCNQLDRPLQQHRPPHVPHSTNTFPNPVTHRLSSL